MTYLDTDKQTYADLSITETANNEQFLFSLFSKTETKEGKSVTDVAAETGFVNTKYFSSLFKKQFGMQPSKYSGK